MALGFPPVTPIRDRSEVALRVDQIRQRLGALDAEVTRLASIADTSSVAASVNGLLRTVEQLILRVSTLESALGATDTLVLAAGEAITSFQVVAPGAPNQCVIADPSDPLARNSVLGVARNGGAIGQSITIQRRAQMTIPGASFETGRQVFLGIGGTLTQDPTYGATSVVVGMAMSSSVIWVGPGDPTLLVPTNYSDPYDDAMPIAWGAVEASIRAIEALLIRPNGYVVLVDGELDTSGALTGIGGGGSGTGTKTLGVFTPMTSQPPASNYATLDTRNSIAVLDFDDTTSESAFWVGIVPEAAALGSGLVVKVHWMATSATTGGVTWAASFERMNTDEDSDSFDTATNGSSTTSGTSGIITVTSITCTNIDGLTAGDAYRLKIARLPSDGSDTMVGDAEIVAVEVQSVA